MICDGSFEEEFQKSKNFKYIGGAKSSWHCILFFFLSSLQNNLPSQARQWSLASSYFLTLQKLFLFPIPTFFWSSRLHNMREQLCSESRCELVTASRSFMERRLTSDGENLPSLAKHVSWQIFECSTWSVMSVIYLLPGQCVVKF